MKAIPAIKAIARRGVGTRPMAFDSSFIPSPTTAKRGGTALAVVNIALALAVMGCNGTPIQTVTPPVPVLQVEINGLMTCNYVNGVLSQCAINSGATLDDFANSLLAGTEVTTQ